MSLVIRQIARAARVRLRTASVRTEGAERWTRIVIGGAGLFSGAALLMHIFRGGSLRASLALTSGAAFVGAAAAWRRTPLAARPALRRTALVGSGVGVVATVAYDASKAVLSRLDPSPYNPFEVLRVFGALLAGPAASPAARLAWGAAFHALNGTCFGIAFCILLGRRGAVAGVAWGLGLEICQLTLYPGWLDIRFYREFAMISSLGHVVYGLVLGIGARRFLPRPNVASPASAHHGPPPAPIGIHGS